MRALKQIGAGLPTDPAGRGTYPQRPPARPSLHREQATHQSATPLRGILPQTDCDTRSGAWLTADAAAALFCVQQGTIRVWAHRYGVPRLRIAGCRVLYDARALADIERATRADHRSGRMSLTPGHVCNTL